MRYLGVACDYDGTIATGGRVDDETLKALERVVASGRKLIMVTGRLLPDLLQVFPPIELFEQVVAENGALLYEPSTREQKALANPPPPEFVKMLQDRDVEPLGCGHIVVNTVRPNENIVLDVIRDLRLDLQVIFNKGAVMVLPRGVDKGTGLMAALSKLGLSPHNVVGFGDAENDVAFLRLCECSVAVANALPSLKTQADVVATNTHGAGVREVIEQLIANDLSDCSLKIGRHDRTKAEI